MYNRTIEKTNINQHQNKFCFFGQTVGSLTAQFNTNNSKLQHRSKEHTSSTLYAFLSNLSPENIRIQKVFFSTSDQFLNMKGYMRRLFLSFDSHAIARKNT